MRIVRHAVGLPYRNEGSRFRSAQVIAVTKFDWLMSACLRSSRRFGHFRSTTGVEAARSAPVGCVCGRLAGSLVVRLLFTRLRRPCVARCMGRRSFSTTAINRIAYRLHGPTSLIFFLYAFRVVTNFGSYLSPWWPPLHRSSTYIVWRSIPIRCLRGFFRERLWRCWLMGRKVYYQQFVGDALCFLRMDVCQRHSQLNPSSCVKLSLI